MSRQPRIAHRQTAIQANQETEADGRWQECSALTPGAVSPQLLGRGDAWSSGGQAQYERAPDHRAIFPGTTCATSTIGDSATSAPNIEYFHELHSRIRCAANTAFYLTPPVCAEWDQIRTGAFTVCTTGAITVVRNRARPERFL